MSDIRITNCHIHTFTAAHTPDRFLPRVTMWLLRQRASRGFILWVLRNAFWWMPRDDLERYARFIEIGAKDSQRKVLDIVRAYYPPETRFIVLPMDMAQMKAGNVPKNLRSQHDELAELASDTELHPAVIPFAAVDPQRGMEAIVEMRRCVEDLGFRGVMLYPPLGYAPADQVLMDEVYPYCAEKNLPVMTHCSRGGVRNRELSKSAATAFASPHAFKTVLEAFPDLRVCLAHFGGGEDWKNYRLEPITPGDSDARAANWLATILDMLRSEQYPNLYTDISYTIFYFEQNAPALKVFLEDAQVRSRVLFGSDFYMSEQRKLRERDLSMKLRADLGRDVFREIAEVNPERYLNGPSVPAHPAPPGGPPIA